MSIFDYIRVSRPPLLFLGLIASLGLLNWSSHLHGDPFRSLLIALAIFFGNWGWNLVNELEDKVVDRINKPWKPVPSGRVSERNIEGLATLLIFGSFFMNGWLAAYYDPVYILGFLAHLTSLVYNTGRRDLLGNICMAATYGIAAFISLYPNQLLFSLAFAMLTLSFNMNTQYQDLNAEKTVDIVTFPQQIDNMNMLNAVLVLEAVLVAPVLLFLKIYLDTGYIPLLIFVLTCIIIMISGHSIFLREKRGKKMVENLTRRLGRLLLIIGFLGMLAI